MTSTRYCFTLELVPDENLIREYEAYHTAIWPEVLTSFTQAGIIQLEMYRSGTTVVMLFDVNEHFSFEKKAAIDRADPVIGQWEALMSRYQQSVPGALADEKWKVMTQFCRVKVPGMDKTAISILLLPGTISSVHQASVSPPSCIHLSCCRVR